MRGTEKGGCRKKRNAYRIFVRKPDGDHLATDRCIKVDGRA